MNNESINKSLNLPKSKFKMKANLNVLEEKTLEFWKKINLYKAIQEFSIKGKPFIINDGPPYANGKIHIGHALNKIIKDIINKSKIFSGYYINYIPGWDCHGLPIELQVEKSSKSIINIKDNKYKLIQMCRKYALKQIKDQLQDFNKLGILADWTNSYNTMNYKFEANIMRSLAKIIENGHLKRGCIPINWCIECNSPLAEAEVEYMTKISHSIYIAFNVLSMKSIEIAFKENCTNQKEIGFGNISIVVWTTTPWTLPSNEAVALNKKTVYTLIQYKNQRFIIAKELLIDFVKKTNINNYKTLRECNGQKLELQLLKHPFYKKEIPIILSDHVDLQSGTGCVHIAPAHGKEDYKVSIKYNLKVINSVNGQGVSDSSINELDKLYINDLNEKIIQILNKKNKLIKQDSIIHSYPHCWRHKSPLIFRTTPQWFISMTNNSLKDKTLELIKDIEWNTVENFNKMNQMLSTRPDWCISRQRTWGVPMPLIENKKTGKLHPNTIEIIYKVANIIEKKGIEEWYKTNIKELISDDENEFYKKSNDTLDVWFDSGVIHFCLIDHLNLQSPVDLYVEGSDQYRGWFQSSILTSIAMKNKIPCKEILTHGFVFDSNNKKMSKSSGDAMSPNKIIKEFGSDILRLWVSSTNYQNDLYISQECLNRIKDSYRKIRNTAKFLLSNLYDFDPSINKKNESELLEIDLWIMLEASNVNSYIIKHYSIYKFHNIYQKINKFCILKLGNFYLDIIKDRLYTCKYDSNARRSAQTAIFYIIELLAKWLAPILSFTAEEIWKNIPGHRSNTIFTNKWTDTKLKKHAEVKINTLEWKNVIKVRELATKEIEKYRSIGDIKSSLDVNLTIYCKKEIYNTLVKFNNELKFVFITSSVNIRKIENESKESAEFKIKVQKSIYKKCKRCWHKAKDTDINIDYPNICLRCIKNLTIGEDRFFA